MTMKPLPESSLTTTIHCCLQVAIVRRGVVAFHQAETCTDKPVVQVTATACVSKQSQAIAAADMWYQKSYQQLQEASLGEAQPLL